MPQENTLPRYEVLNHPLDLAPRSAERFNRSVSHVALGKPRMRWPFSVSTALFQKNSALSLNLRSARTADHSAVLPVAENSSRPVAVASFVC